MEHSKNIKFKAENTRIFQFQKYIYQLACCLVLLLIFNSNLYATEIEYMPEVEVDLICNEIDAKAYYADGAVSHVKLDGEALRVKIRSKYLSMEYPSIGIPTKYDYVSGFFNEKLPYLNQAFVNKNGGMWGTKTVTHMYNGKMWLIQTEPAIENGRPYIRTHYHWCELDK